MGGILMPLVWMSLGKGHAGDNGNFDALGLPDWAGSLQIEHIRGTHLLHVDVRRTCPDRGMPLLLHHRVMGQ
jgi:hypothetical protein